jgi:ABC-type sugar transport system ATPase subunit
VKRKHNKSFSEKEHAFVDVAIQTHNLTKRYGSFTALDNLNLEVKQGEVLGY